MNWKNRLRRAKEDADDDDEDEDDDDDDENDDYGDYEGVLNGGVAESGLVFSQRNSAGYALDAKLLTKSKDGGGWRNDVGKIFPTPPQSQFFVSLREFALNPTTIANVAIAAVAAAVAAAAAVLPPRLPRRTCRECRRSYLENRRGIEDRP
ncbi:hypothetical protein ACFW04_001662 [Cataglyphis niger]